MSKIIQKKTKVISNLRLTEGHYKLTLNLPGVAGCAQPGQFVNLRISGNYQPLLRRPFSIHSVNNSKPGHKGQIQILYQVVGKGTRILSEKKPGEYLDVLGPLGNGFAIPDSAYPILVAGGMGVAPLFFLAQRLISLRQDTKNLEPVVLIGARTKKEILCQKEFASMGFSVKISTDDGSAGFKGKVTGLLRPILDRVKSPANTMIYACGPKPMLLETSIISRRYNIPAQVSLDEYMACGLGVCLGCMVETRKGNQLVCRDGPVFEASEIVWQKR